MSLFAELKRRNIFRAAAAYLVEIAQIEHDPALSDVAIEPLLGNLHEDARWLPLLRRIGRAPDQLDTIRFDVKVPK